MRFASHGRLPLDRVQNQTSPPQRPVDPGTEDDSVDG